MLHHAKFLHDALVSCSVYFFRCIWFSLIVRYRFYLILVHLHHRRRPIRLPLSRTSSVTDTVRIPDLPYNFHTAVASIHERVVLALAYRASTFVDHFQSYFFLPHHTRPVRGWRLDLRENIILTGGASLTGRRRLRSTFLGVLSSYCLETDLRGT